ncbi:MAG: fructose-bisphosphate aldolase class I [Pelagibacteraceae bacterium]|jgi:fructose-bisphosphate aldolase, class I|nr:fructose-bisphosphate aldolase class I [Pelagibacteraceae bacterium]MCI5078909.1 fructose-bisphosphate aldolase class I [Pelagibacteraceae bacterium]
MNINEIAKLMVAKGKGILAADESTGTMTKRLDSVGIDSNPENRLNFRYTLFTSKEFKNYISGALLFDETIRQEKNGKSIPEILSEQKVLPGIKVDKGAKKLVGSDETVTEGLDGLRERLSEYYKLGARFAKWRGVYKISNEFPSNNSIIANAHALARYAALVQEVGMAPIVEPEVLMDGKHDIQKCYDVTSKVLEECMNQLRIAGIDFSGMVLKPNMILNGSESGIKNKKEQVAELTLKCIQNQLPKEVPGVAFLSGGQSEFEATENLNEINKKNKTTFAMTYSYGRALQQSALKTWAKNLKDTEAVQKVFDERSRMNSLAAKGEWKADLENAA